MTTLQTWRKQIEIYLPLFLIVAFVFLGLANPIARVILLIIGMYIVYSMVKCQRMLSRPVVFNVFSLILLNFIYFLLSDKTIRGAYTMDITTFGYFANLFLNLGIFFVPYYYVQKDKFNDNNIKIFFVFLFLASLYSFMIEREEAMIERDGRATLNAVYGLVIILPYLFLFKNKIITLAFLGAALYCVLWGSKRGAIVIFIVFSVYYLYIRFYKRTERMRFLMPIIAIAIFMAGYYFAQKIFMENEYLQLKYDLAMAGDTNGREELYNKIFNKWSSENSIFHILFGYGFNSSMVITGGTRAHNDWFELMATAGLLGILVFISLFVRLIQTHFSFKKYDRMYIIDSIIIIWGLRSLFSMSYMDVNNMPLCFILGYELSKIHKAFKVQFSKVKYRDKISMILYEHTSGIL